MSKENGRASHARIPAADRMPPHNIEVEECLLGSIFLDNEVLAKVRDTIKSDDFFRDTHQVVYATMLDLVDSGKPIDCVLMAEELQRRGSFDALGGDELLAKLTNCTPHAVNGPHYAEIMLELSRKREAIEALRRGLEVAYGGQTLTNQFVARTIGDLSDVLGRSSQVKGAYRGMSDEELGILPLTSVSERAIVWLWYYRLQRGGMAIVAGNAGIGKSQILLAIASAVTNGGAWPDGNGKAPIGHVVIVAAEDRPETTIKPRLIAMGADLSKVTVLKARYTLKKKGKPDAVHFATFADLGYWQEVLSRIPGVVLFIVDPVPSDLGKGVNDSRNVEIRAVLEPFLHEVIEPLDIRLLGNTHLNKNVDSRTPLHRISGSIAYGAIPRNIHFVLRDPDVPATRYFTQEKTNDAPDDLKAMAFQIERREIVGPGGEVIETAIPVFQAETVAIDTGALVNGTSTASRRGPTPAKTTKAAEWLFDYLAGQPGPSLLAAIFDAAGNAGLIGTKGIDKKWTGASTLYDARKLIPNFPPPRNGKRVDDLKAPIHDRGRHLVHWHMVDADAVF